MRERPSTGLVNCNTSSWGEDATQVYSTEEVCRRAGNQRTVRTFNYTLTSFDAIHSVCALPEPSKNT